MEDPNLRIEPLTSPIDKNSTPLVDLSINTTATTTTPPPVTSPKSASSNSNLKQHQITPPPPAYTDISHSTTTSPHPFNPASSTATMVEPTSPFSDDAELASNQLRSRKSMSSVRSANATSPKKGERHSADGNTIDTEGYAPSVVNLLDDEAHKKEKRRTSWTRSLLKLGETEESSAGGAGDGSPTGGTGNGGRLKSPRSMLSRLSIGGFSELRPKSLSEPVDPADPNNIDVNDNETLGGGEGMDVEDEGEEQEDPPKIPTHAEIDTMFKDDPKPPLSKEELRAFYIYAWATEPFVIVCLTALMPLILQGMAAGTGRESSDITKPCNYTVPQYRCVVNVGGNTWVDVSSFSFYTTSISVALQAFVFISLGALADHGAWRKKFMVLFAFACTLFNFGYVLVRDASLFWVCSLLFIAANVAFGASSVFYHAYIPLLAQAHWDVLAQTASSRREKGKKFSQKRYAAAVDATSNTISSISSAMGHFGSVACFACAGIIVFTLSTFVDPFSPLRTGGFNEDKIGGANNKMGVETYAKQLGCGFVTIWMLVGLYFVQRYMRVRPGPPFKPGTNTFTYSWKKVFNTVRKARRLPNTFLFLGAWFLFSDGEQTVGTVTILFAQVELGFSATEIIGLAIAAPIVAGAGNFLWLRFQRWKKWSTKKMLIFLLCLNLAVPIYGLLGFFLPFGLRIKWELIFVGIYYGSLLGAIQSYFRVWFSEILPPGQEAEFFSLYAITDKGSSWFGPLIVGAITQVSSMRYSWYFLVFMLGIPIILLWYVDDEKGKRDAHMIGLMDSDEPEAAAAEAI
ncbi:Autophagy protein 22 [Chytridiales sp. JEL 0842]|nr:Autophagy protein 22 [Chytridiales sp. JEL 0842]